MIEDRILGISYDVLNLDDDYGLDKYKKNDLTEDLKREWTYQEVWDEVFNSGSIIPKTLSEAHRVVFVDADGITYRTSAAVESRSVKSVVEGVKVEFPTRTLLKEYCVDVDVEYEDLVVTDHHENEPIGNCLSTLKKSVRNLYRDLDATHVIFLLGGSGNFRLDLPLPTQYKATRKNLRRPDYLKDCRDYLIKNYDTFVIKGLEADDVCEGLTDYVINNTSAWGCGVSMDKDYNGALRKNRYLHLVNRNIVELSGGIGNISLKKGKIAGEGLHFLLYQVFMGDTSDGFSPKKFFNKRFGDTSYYNNFKDYTNEKDLLIAWINKWKELLPERIMFTTWQGDEIMHSWRSLAELYFQCPYMLISPDDETTFTSLLNKYGVSYE